ncbi:PAS domain S-box protein [Halobacillus amylolyticus]|uniref:histidine kinase n=1 Tax=Halobacillus amylolyticus TaxID=2932259 RepID=A0ABY4H9Z2_9BACI|nr:PAS domain S-box protein [Halobacillus amylolyticus]UOR11696.1 PAS domain S-box protein [Halobacillus amylolyticus]
MKFIEGLHKGNSLQKAVFQAPDRHVLRILMEGMSDFVFLMEVIDYDMYKYLYINHTSEQCYQLDRSNWEGKLIEDMLEPENASYIKSHYNQVVETAAPVTYRDTVDINGYEFAGQTLLTPFRDETGKVVQILAITRDITELAKKEQELDTVNAVYRSLLKNTADAILIVNLDGEVLESNLAFEKLYGFTKEELKEDRFPFVPFSLKSEADELIEKAVRKKHISAYETKRRHKNGVWIDVSVSVSPIYGNDGDVIGVSSVVRNISEQKVMNQKLKAIHSRYQSLFEFNPYPVVTLTLRGTITKANPAMLQMPNFEEEELLHSSFTKWIHEEDIDHVHQHIRGSFSGKKIWFQTRLIARRAERIVNVFLTPILTGQRKAGMYAILEDITEKEVTMRALKQSEAKFKLIADHSQDLISVFSPYGKLMYGSPSHVDFFGFDPVDADVDKIATVVHPKEMDQLVESFCSLL